MTIYETSGLQAVPADFTGVPSVSWELIHVLAGAVVLVTLAAAVLVTWRTRSPLMAWLLVSCAMCAVLAEPLGDIVGGIILSPDAPGRLFTILGRPMPILDIFVWVCMAPSWYLAYRLIETGAPRARLIGVAAAIGVTEVCLEALFVHWGAMLYYSNHALVAGIPVSSIAQNIGITLIGGVALHVVLPHIRGLRWLWFATLVPSVMMGYAFAATLPSYIAIHEQVGPLLGWTLGLISAYLNLAVALAATKLPTIAARRVEAASRHTAGVPEVPLVPATA